MSESLAVQIARIIGTKPHDECLLEMPGVNCAVGTTIGRVRKENQDRAVIARGQFLSRNSAPFLLLAIADGIGGMRDGALCATRTLAHLLEALTRSREANIHNALMDAIYACNEEVYKTARGEGGATLSALLIDKTGRTVIGNVGDSRVYQFVPKVQSSIIQLTTDDTIEAQLNQLNNRAITEPLDVDHGRLVQYIGMGKDIRPMVIPIRNDQLDLGYLLTTDGVHRYGARLITGIGANAISAAEMTNRLLRVSSWMGGVDNATAICMFPETLRRFVGAKALNESLLTIWTPTTQCEFLQAGFEVNALRAHYDLSPPAPNYKIIPSYHAPSNVEHNQSPIENKPRAKNAKKGKKPTTQSRPHKNLGKQQMKIRFVSTGKKDDD